ncbi:unnamed protein product, partial [marine sediment metagenome]
MKSKVAVIKTNPDTVLDDIEKALKLADVDKFLKKDAATILKINISWHFYYPACSTTPWQLDGVASALLRKGYRDLIPAQNRTVVINPKRGAENNHLTSVLKKHQLKFIYLYEPEIEWITYKPKAKMLVLDKVYKKMGIQIPKMFIGKTHFIYRHSK